MDFNRDYELSEVVRKLSYELNRNIDYSVRDIVYNDEIKEGIVVSFLRGEESERTLSIIENIIVTSMLSEMVVEVKTYKDVWNRDIRINICFIDEYKKCFIFNF